MQHDALRCTWMRTTVNLDPDLHAEALARASSQRSTLSDVLNDALRSTLHPIPPVEIDPVPGLGVIRLGKPITSADVATALDDDLTVTAITVPSEVALIDANVLIALSFADHEHHVHARAWLGERRFATTPTVQGALARYATRLATPAHAAAVLDALNRHDRHEFWPDDVPSTARSSAE